MNNEKIKVLVKKPYQHLEEVCIDNQYKSIREIIGGNIDYMHLQIFNEKNIELVVNDEFLIDGSAINFAYGNSSVINGIVNGNVIFVATKDEDNISLNDEQIKFIKDIFQGCFAFDRNGNVIPVLEN